MGSEPTLVANYSNVRFTVSMTMPASPLPAPELPSITREIENPPYRFRGAGFLVSGPLEPLIDLNRPSYATWDILSPACQLHPEVLPQVSHFRQVPLRTMVKLPHSAQFSPS